MGRMSKKTNPLEFINKLHINLVLLNIPQNSTPSAPIPSCLSAFTIDLTNLSTDKVTTV